MILILKIREQRSYLSKCCNKMLLSKVIRGCSRTASKLDPCAIKHLNMMQSPTLDRLRNMLLLYYTFYDATKTTVVNKLHHVVLLRHKSMFEHDHWSIPRRIVVSLDSTFPGAFLISPTTSGYCALAFRDSCIKHRGSAPAQLWPPKMLTGAPLMAIYKKKFST